MAFAGHHDDPNATVLRPFRRVRRRRLAGRADSPNDEEATLRRTSPAVLLATLTGNLAWVVGTVALGVAAILVSWVPPRGTAVFLVARWWARLILAASFIRLDVRREAAPEEYGASVFMANHRSMYDIPVLLATLPGQARFMAKKSLFKIPIFGWAIALGGFIPVDREDRRTARKTFAAAVDRLRHDVSVVVFPEETRSAGPSLLRFRPGGFLLALRSGLPIVPVGVRGTSEVRPKGSLWISPRRIEVRYGSPLPTAGLSVHDRRRVTDEVRNRVAALSGLAAD